MNTHGGKRKNAGAKPKPEHLKKEQTKVMRIPVSKVEAVKKLIGKALKQQNQHHYGGSLSEDYPVSFLDLGPEL